MCSVEWHPSKGGLSMVGGYSCALFLFRVLPHLLQPTIAVIMHWKAHFLYSLS